LGVGNKDGRLWGTGKVGEKKKLETKKRLDNHTTNN